MKFIFDNFHFLPYNLGQNFTNRSGVSESPTPARAFRSELTEIKGDAENHGGHCAKLFF
jgi:hypothetical protein